MAGYKPDLDQVLAAVLQLSKDRKNGYGGYAQGLMNMEELGPHQGGNWPLTAEFIKRNFGKPKDRDNPENSGYVETMRGRSHVRLEWEVQNYLRPYAPELYRAYESVFSPDLAGDRDYEYLVARSKSDVEVRDQRPDARPEGPPRVRRYKKIKGTTPREEMQAASEVTPEEKPTPKWLERNPTAAPRREMYAQEARTRLMLVDGALQLLAMRLKDDDLIVDFAKARTYKEDKELEDRDRSMYFRYMDLRESGKRPKAAKQIIADAEGISLRRVEQIVESQRALAGEEPRGRGRPKKEERQ